MVKSLAIATLARLSRAELRVLGKPSFLTRSLCRTHGPQFVSTTLGTPRDEPSRNVTIRNCNASASIDAESGALHEGWLHF